LPPGRFVNYEIDCPIAIIAEPIMHTGQSLERGGIEGGADIFFGFTGA
jgi:hypothetical protein